MKLSEAQIEQKLEVLKKLLKRVEHKIPDDWGVQFPDQDGSFGIAKAEVIADVEDASAFELTENGKGDADGSLGNSHWAGYYNNIYVALKKL